MSASMVQIEVPLAQGVAVTKDTLRVDLSDGRTVSLPLAWFPRLVHASVSERNNWRLIGRGHGIHWEGLDEDISVEGLLASKPSGESQTSFAKWLRKRNPRPRPASSGRRGRRG
jgi:hypothetical protein